MKFFIVTVLTLAYIVRTDKFRNRISIRAHSVTRIVLTTFKKAIIYFYCSWCIAKASLNVLKSLTVIVLTLTHTVRIDRFRNYISTETYSIIRIILVSSMEVIIYFDPL